MHYKLSFTELLYLLSYMDTCVTTIMYCQRLFLLFTGKQHCIQTNKYDQSRGVTEIYTPTKFVTEYGFVFKI